MVCGESQQNAERDKHMMQRELVTVEVTSNVLQRLLRVFLWIATDAGRTEPFTNNAFLDGVPVGERTCRCGIFASVFFCRSSCCGNASTSDFSQFGDCAELLSNRRANAWHMARMETFRSSRSDEGLVPARKSRRASQGGQAPPKMNPTFLRPPSTVLP